MLIPPCSLCSVLGRQMEPQRKAGWSTFRELAGWRWRQGEWAMTEVYSVVEIHRLVVGKPPD